MPELLAGIGVEGLEFAGELAGEHDTAAGCKHAGEARQLARRFPLGLAGQGINRLQDAAVVVLRPLPEIRSEIDPEVELPDLIFDWNGLVIISHVERVD